MLSALTLILSISGVLGRPSSICALKGLSVDLLCVAEPLTSSIKWFTVHHNESRFVQVELPGEDHPRFNASAERNFTLSVQNLMHSDAKFYCCSNTAGNPGACWVNRTRLDVADLQVKVTPSRDGQMTTLMCSSSCRLTEDPAGYIWYRNGEVLYEDRSPWYQELVGSEEGVTYSCAIKGYEDLRTPEVSVNSVTSTCFNVTYAGGTMCPHEDEPCSIIYPTEVRLQKTYLDQTYTRLSCGSSCPLMDPRTAFRWYRTNVLYKYSDSQKLTVPTENKHVQSYYCAVKGNEDLHTSTDCIEKGICSTLNYVSRRICALEGSSVNITCEYIQVNGPLTMSWKKIRRSGEKKEEEDVELTAAGRSEYHINMSHSHTLLLKHLNNNDSAEYKLDALNGGWNRAPGVTVVVTGLKVTFSRPDVKGNQRVTLTCSTSCPLADNRDYVWFFNGQPLCTRNQSKHLVLDPVGSQHEGNYSCAVKTHYDIRSPEETLTVDNSVVIMNVVRLAAALLIPVPLLLFHLWLRWRKSRW